MRDAPKARYVIQWSDDQPGWRDALRLERHGTIDEVIAEARSMVTAATQRVVVTGLSGVLFDSAGPVEADASPSGVAGSGTGL